MIVVEVVAVRETASIPVLGVSSYRVLLLAASVFISTELAHPPASFLASTEPTSV